jgi:glycerol uptake facilitator-like aquaporin
MELTNQISAFEILRQRMGQPVTWTSKPAEGRQGQWSNRMFDALRRHWPEYLMEATELGLFMLSACAFTVLLYHPSSPLAQAIPDGLPRRLMMGIAMGSTAIAIVFSPIGKRSGAHFNPAVTWTFFRLGKIDAWDAAFYTLFQFTGGIAGVMLASLALSPRRHPHRRRSSFLRAR